MGAGEQERMKCVSCKSEHADVEFGQSIYFLDQCCELVCSKCLKEAIEKGYPDVKCPNKGCKAKVAEYEIRSILGEKAYEALQTEMTNKLLDQEKGIVRCKCGNAIEVVKGEVYYDYKNDEG